MPISQINMGTWTCDPQQGKQGRHRCTATEEVGAGQRSYLLFAMLYTSVELVSPVSVTPAATKMRPSWTVAPKSDRAVCMGASSFHSNFLGS